MVATIISLHENFLFISTGDNGLLFDSPSSFISCLETLIEDEDIHWTMTKAALKYVNDTHNPGKENESYCCLIHSACSN